MSEKRSYGGQQRVLVTGGAGSLGSLLIDRLLERQVVCVDNLFDGFLFDDFAGAHVA